MQDPVPGVSQTDAGVRYLFIVTRKNPDILARVQERLHGDHRIDVIADRRYGDRRRATAPQSPERRAGDRRRPTNVWNDLTIYPTLVAQRHVDSYAELERKAADAALASQTARIENERLRETGGHLERRIDALTAAETQLRGENTRLREEIAELQRRLGALAAAEGELKAEVTAVVAQAEQALGGLISKFRRFAPDAGEPRSESTKEPRLRSL
jgi:FtsZ-binding cell division protein ZapB